MTFRTIWVIPFIGCTGMFFFGYLLIYFLGWSDLEILRDMHSYREDARMGIGLPVVLLVGCLWLIWMRRITVVVDDNQIRFQGMMSETTVSFSNIAKIKVGSNLGDLVIFHSVGKMTIRGYIERFPELKEHIVTRALELNPEVSIERLGPFNRKSSEQ